MSTARLVEEVRRLRERRHDGVPEVPPDPVEFARSLGIEPDAWQENLLRSTAPRILLNITRQGGKSTMAAIMALHQALTTPRSLVLILAPSERQAKETFGKAAALYRHDVPADSYRKLGMQLRNSSRIEALPGTEKTIRGFSGVDLLILDEAARIDVGLYYAVAPMLAVSGGRMIMMSTPYGRRGIFHQEWTEGAQWERYEVPASECPRIPDSFLENERQSMPEWWFAQEFGCEFRETEDQLFSNEMIEAARADDLPELTFEGDDALWS